MYGYDPDFHIDIADNVSPERVPAAKERILKLQHLRDQLRNQWIQAQERQQKSYNQRHQEAGFKQGILVKLSTRNLKLKDKKLQTSELGAKHIDLHYRTSIPDCMTHSLYSFLNLTTPKKDQLKCPCPNWRITQTNTKWKRSGIR
jgi:hypothetical protein